MLILFAYKNQELSLQILDLNIFSVCIKTVERKECFGQISAFLGGREYLTYILTRHA